MINLASLLKEETILKLQGAATQTPHKPERKPTMSDILKATEEAIADEIINETRNVDRVAYTSTLEKTEEQLTRLRDGEERHVAVKDETILKLQNEIQEHRKLIEKCNLFLGKDEPDENSTPRKKAVAK